MGEGDGMGAWERGEETRKAWEVFKIYRDLGPERTLKKAAAIHYGCTQDALPKYRYDQVRRWSAKHGWGEKVEAHDARDETIRREAIEAHERARLASVAEREARLQEELLSVKEAVLRKLRTMANWPLEHTVQERDGKEIHVHPARWSFGTLLRAIEVLDDKPTRSEVTVKQGGNELEEEFRRLHERIREEEWRALMEIEGDREDPTRKENDEA